MVKFSLFSILRALAVTVLVGGTVTPVLFGFAGISTTVTRVLGFGEANQVAARGRTVAASAAPVANRESVNEALRLGRLEASSASPSRVPASTGMPPQALPTSPSLPLPGAAVPMVAAFAIARLFRRRP